MNGIAIKSTFCLSRSTSSKPSISAMRVSEMIRSGAAVSTLASASWPLTAVVTLKPDFLRLTSRTRKLLVSPSTSRRLCFAISPYEMAKLNRRDGDGQGHARRLYGTWYESVLAAHTLPVCCLYVQVLSVPMIAPSAPEIDDTVVTS